MKISNGLLATLIIVGVIILDQIIKIWVKNSFYLGESVHITDWFQLVFVENNGMAFGMELGNKIFLTLFRIVAVSLGIWYISRIVSRDYITKGYIACCSLIAAGAAGNVIDCLFYGPIFGYAPLFYGRVVDMFYFPLFSFNWPDWMPWVGGEHFTFFQPVFNLADAAISIGIFILIIFYSKNFATPKEEKSQEKAK